MTDKMNVTLAQIKKIFGISRTTFNEKYKDHVLQVPSLTNVNLYDYDSVKAWHDNRPKSKRGRKVKQILSTKN